MVRQNCDYWNIQSDAAAALDEQEARTYASSQVTLSSWMWSYTFSLALIVGTINTNIPCDALPSHPVDDVTVHRITNAKLSPALPPIFLQSCETKSGMETLGLRLGIWSYGPSGNLDVLLRPF